MFRPITKKARIEERAGWLAGMGIGMRVGVGWVDHGRGDFQLQWLQDKQAPPQRSTRIAAIPGERMAGNCRPLLTRGGGGLR